MSLFIVGELDQVAFKDPFQVKTIDSMICWNKPLLRCGLQYLVEIRACSQNPRWRENMFCLHFGYDRAFWIGSMLVKLQALGDCFFVSEISVFLLPTWGHPLSLTKEWTLGALWWSFLNLPCEMRTTWTQVRDQCFEIFCVFSGQLYLTKMLLHICFGVLLRTFKAVLQ